MKSCGFFLAMLIAWGTCEAQSVMIAGVPKPEPTYVTSIKPFRRIQEKDIAWQKRVWRDATIIGKWNTALDYHEGAPVNSDLTSVLIEGVLAGKIAAYAAGDAQFKFPLSREEFSAILTPGSGRFPGGLNPRNIAGYEITEDWLFLNSRDSMIVRLLALAPMVTHLQPDGTEVTAPAFCVYYPDCRDYLAAHKVYGENVTEDLNWVTFLESRQWHSTIEKVEEMHGQ